MLAGATSLSVVACGNLLGIDFDAARLAAEPGNDATPDGTAPGEATSASSSGSGAIDPDCVSPSDAQVCPGRCGAVRDDCGRIHDCETRCGNARCFETVCCEPRGCGEACGSELDDGCGGTLECPLPPAPAVCHEGVACTPESAAEACGDRCGAVVSDGCGGEIVCEVAAGAVCFEGSNCYPLQCDGSSCLQILEPGCGLPSQPCQCQGGLVCCPDGTCGGGGIEPLEEGQQRPVQCMLQ